jgi:F-type H+-transporting ATPase subunit delta
MATQTDAVSTTYARSLYELAEGAGADKVREVAQELADIVELARGDRNFREFLQSPLIDAAKRRTSLQRIFADRVTDLTLRFLLVLNEKDRLPHLESIVAAYGSLVDEAQGRVEVDLWTAAPMGQEQLEVVTARIREALGKDPVIHPYTDPDMMGGIKLRIGDQLVDGSLATRLRRLRQSLLAEGGSNVRARAASMIEGAGATGTEGA